MIPVLQEKALKTPALNIEEAAMLTAIPSRHPDGGAALRTAMRAADQMKEKQVRAVETGETRQKKNESASAPTPPRNRAALRQVWRR